MTEEYVLPLRPAPIEDESLLGYLQRLAEANSCDRVHWITDLAGFEPKQASVGQAELASLARMCRVDSERLEQMRYPQLAEGYVSFMGHSLPRELLRNRYQKVCGPCLSEAGYHRAVWDLAFVTACPVHEVELIDACFDCGQPLRWNRPSATRCGCEAELTQQSGAPVTTEDAEALDGILQRFQSYAGRCTEPNSPEDLDPSELLELIQFLGRNSLYAQTGVPQQGRTLDRPDILQVLRNGFDIAQRWPHQFYDLLDRCRDQQGRDATITSLFGQFGPIFRGIARLDANGWGGIVQSAFRSYLEANPDIPWGGSSAAIVAELDQRSAYFSFTEAADILKISHKEFRSLMKSAEGKRIRSKGQGRYRCYHREDVEAFARQPADAVARKQPDAINLKTLGRRLGVPTKRVLRRIADSRIFGVLEQASHGDGRSVYVSSRDVEAFFDRLDAAARRGNANGNTVSFRSALSSCSERGVDLPKFLAMLQREEIEPVGLAPEGTGLDRYRFDADALAEKLDAALEARTGTVSAVTAAKRLPIHITAVYDLVELGLLKAREMKGKAPKGLRISNEAIDAFQRRFITGPGVARELGINPRRVNRVLRQPDLSRKALAAVGERKTPIYERDSINLGEVAALARG